MFIFSSCLFSGVFGVCVRSVLVWCRDLLLFCVFLLQEATLDQYIIHVSREDWCPDIDTPYFYGQEYLWINSPLVQFQSLFCNMGLWSVAIRVGKKWNPFGMKLHFLWVYHRELLSKESREERRYSCIRWQRKSDLFKHSWKQCWRWESFEIFFTVKGSSCVRTSQTN